MRCACPRYFEEHRRSGGSASAVATEAMRRWVRIYHAEGAVAGMSHDERRRARLTLSKPLWDELKVWLKHAAHAGAGRGRKTAEAID